MNVDYPNLTDEQVARVRAAHGAMANRFLNDLNSSAEERRDYFELTREETRLIISGRYEAEDRVTAGLDPATGPIVQECIRRGLIRPPT
ncbi:MAG: hypothetical protein LBJ62_11145 [Bifidobacteriaceae bacterium]|jgi:hypothetical protein|nr:hypothetical protein [Bifidobacteriaceae bacterium]